MIEKQIWPLLDRYFSGVASADEAEQVARWVGDDSERKQYLTSIETMWRVAGESGPAHLDLDGDRFNAESALAQIQGRMQRTRNGVAVPAARPLTATPPQAVSSTTPYPSWAEHTSEMRSPRRIWSFGLVAAFCLLAMAGLISYNIYRDTSTSIQNIERRTYATGKGQRTEILLPDGTRAVLSVESRVQVPSDYGARTRDIYLDGEAFFEVTHDAKKPFRVHAAGTLAEDLGTEFVVRAYRGEHPTVVVASGLVAWRGDTSALSHRVLLSPGQLGRWDTARHMTTVHDVDASAYLTWMHGRLDFKNAPLSQVTRELERWYDVQIVIADSSLVSADLTTTIKTQPLDEVLGMISKALDIEYTRRGTQVIFSVRGSSK